MLASTGGGVAARELAPERFRLALAELDCRNRGEGDGLAAAAVRDGAAAGGFGPLPEGIDRTTTLVSARSRAVMSSRRGERGEGDVIVAALLAGRSG